MKLQDNVRISPRRDKASLVEAVNQYPGATSMEIAKHMGAFNDRDRNLVTSRLWYLANAAQPVVKRIKQDGFYRFYPINHKYGLDVVAYNPTPKVEPVDIKAPSIEEMAKNFVWETGSYDLKQFVEWSKK